MTGRILETANLIEVRQGDSFPICFYFHKEKEGFDLSSCVILMQVRDENDLVVLQKEAVITDEKEGKAVINLMPTDTANISVGDYKTDIQLTLKNGEVHTIFPADVRKIGIFRITEQVTR